MSDPLDERAQELWQEYCENGRAVEVIARGLRTVQRETAQECCHVLYFTDMPKVPATWQKAISYLRDAIKSRFGLDKEEHEQAG